MARNHHVVALALGHTGSDGAHANLAYQLDADAGMGRHVFQIMNQLRQVFDGINVVVRGGRDQPHTRHTVAQTANVLRHLAAGQLATLTRLGTLRHLDLDLVSAVQVLGRHTETARGYLLDFGAQRVTGLQRNIHRHHVVADDVGHGLALPDRDAFELLAVTRRVFTTLTRVALAADAVHRHGKRGVRFGRDGAQRHGAGGETLDDLFGGLNLVHRNRLGRVYFELEQAAQRHVPAALVVDEFRIFLVGVPVVGARGMLQLGNRIRRPHVFFATHTPGILTPGIEHV